MGKRSRRYEEQLKAYDGERLHDLRDGVGVVKKLASAKFDETVDLYARLGVNPRHADQQVRGTVVLPHGTGQVVRIIAFAQGEKAKEAEEAGADEVGAEELAEKIQGGWLDFDVAVATPDMMRVVGKLGRILGPRGLMPNPKVGTVTFDLKEAIGEIKRGKVEYRVDKTSNIHVPAGKVSFEEEHLFNNLVAVLEALIKDRPPAAKGRYLRSVTLSSTMGPGVRIDPQQVTALFM